MANPLLARPRTHLGTTRPAVINQYPGYAQAGIGSYEQIDQSYYQTYQHETPWHAGAPGWASAPVPGWGMNPNLALPRRQAINGLGAYYGNHYTAPIGIGAPTDAELQKAWDAEKTAMVIAVTALVGLGVAKVWLRSKSKGKSRKR